MTRLDSHFRLRGGPDGLVESASNPLLRLISSCTSPELQFPAFLQVLPVVNVYEAFATWKRSWTFCAVWKSNSEAPHPLSVNLISILYHQLGDIPAGLLCDIVSLGQLLTSTPYKGALADDRKWAWNSCKCESTRELAFLLSVAPSWGFPSTEVKSTVCHAETRLWSRFGEDPREETELTSNISFENWHRQRSQGSPRLQKSAYTLAGTTSASSCFLLFQLPWILPILFKFLWPLYTPLSCHLNMPQGYWMI